MFALIAAIGGAWEWIALVVILVIIYIVFRNKGKSNGN